MKYINYGAQMLTVFGCSITDRSEVGTYSILEKAGMICDWKIWWMNNSTFAKKGFHAMQNLLTN